jgi:hypothetical protein
MISALLSHHSTKSRKLQLREQYVDEAEEKSQISVKAQHVLVQLQKQLETEKRQGMELKQKLLQLRR